MLWQCDRLTFNTAMSIVFWKVDCDRIFLSLFAYKGKENVYIFF